jgi:hypothetical protein
MAQAMASRHAGSMLLICNCGAGPCPGNRLLFRDPGAASCIFLQPDFGPASAPLPCKLVFRPRSDRAHYEKERQ